jgi:putative peptidoglycan lipid II flippase
MVSRTTGLLRLVTVAAVLGPTAFADLYQAATNLPMLIFELLAGGLLTSLLVPTLVRHLDAGDAAAAGRVASGLLSVVLAAGLVLVVVVVATGPLVLGILTASAPDDVPRVAVGLSWLLLSVLIIQVPLYLWVGVAAAAQNAQGRFALPAGAPAVENLATVVTLAVYAVVFGRGSPEGLPGVVLLGCGTTAAVLLHAAVQSWGARRCGVRLRPRATVRLDPEVRGLLRLAAPSLGYAGLEGGRYLCLILVAAAVPGGVLAFTIAWAFYNLPVALGARPVAQAALRALARAHQQGDPPGFSETFNRGLGLVLFVAVPAGVGYVLLARPLITAIAYGEMASAHGRAVLEVCLWGLGLGVIGHAAVIYATQAAYAQGDASRPLRAVAVRTAVAGAGMIGSLLLLDGPMLLLCLGLSITVSDLVAGALLCRWILRPLPRPTTSPALTLTRTLAGALVLVPVVLLLQSVLRPPAGQLGGVLVTAAAGVAGAMVYLAAQWAFRSPEATALFRLLRRPADEEFR